MKQSLKMLLAATALATAAVVGAAPAAYAQPAIGFSFSVGDVAFAYSDGYYDRNRRWHRWRNERERAWYRAKYSRSYYNYRRDRDRYRDRRWRDFDRDGIPNRYDRDRDNDGVPNRYDNRPNNPYRN